MSNHITFKKINEVYIQLQAEAGVLMEMAEKFSKYVPGYQYQKAFIKGHWNGKTNYINYTNGLFYGGLLKDVWKSCKESGYKDFSFVGFDKTSPYTADIIADRLAEFKLPKHIPEIYDYQIEGILEGLIPKRRTIVSVTSSGKSLILYAMCRILAEDGYEILLQVPSVMLVNQLYNDFKDYASIDKFDVEKHVHKIYAGQDKLSPKPIIISTWQSISEIEKKAQKEFLERFDVVLNDEVHTCNASVLKGIMEKTINAQWRIGLTGTLDDEIKVLRETIVGLFGKEVVINTTKELMDAGRVANLNIEAVVLDYPEELRRLVSKMDYFDEMDTIVGYTARNEVICKLATKLTGNVLIITKLIDKHAKPLKAMLEKMTDKEIILIDKDTAAEVREEIRQRLETVDNAIIIATYKLISTGVSIKSLRHLIFGTPLKSRIAVLQAIGRILRISKTKLDATLWDIVDDLVMDRVPNYAMDHFKVRYGYYVQQEFNVKIRKHKI